MSKIKLKHELSVISISPTLQNRGYRIIKKINEGSYAKVYLGEFVSSKFTTKLAVKVLEAKRSPRESVNKFLTREINILTQIEHPHIIHIHSIMQVGLKFYIFMRYAEQGDLLEFLIKYGQVNEDQARVWSRQIALAIQYLHEMNIAHRDLKCENILLTVNYNVKLSDFGFARYTIDADEKPILSETYCGTLLYAAPEILHGHSYNPKLSDLWSIGVVIYVMLNKSLPYDDQNAKVLYENQINRTFKFRSKVVDLLSNEVKLLVEDLLEPDPLKRCSIQSVLNSDWISMDKRLETLSADEKAALASAIDYHPQKLPISFVNYKLKTVQKPIEINKQQSFDIEDIKPYNNKEPRVSVDMYAKNHQTLVLNQTETPKS